MDKRYCIHDLQTGNTFYIKDSSIDYIRILKADEIETPIDGENFYCVKCNINFITEDVNCLYCIWEDIAKFYED